MLVSRDSPTWPFSSPGDVQSEGVERHNTDISGFQMLISRRGSSKLSIRFSGK